MHSSSILQYLTSEEIPVHTRFINLNLGQYANFPEWEKWRDVLRSGKYHQGKGRLQTVLHEDRHYYCCLGVLADMLVNEGSRLSWGVSVQRGESHMSSTLLCLDGCSQSPREDTIPYEVWLETMFVDPTDAFNMIHLQRMFVKANDNGATFDQIAQFIDDHILRFAP